MSKESGPGLREYIETRLNLLDERLKDMDVRYEQRFKAQQEAITKSETAVERRLEGVNEFRKTLADQSNLMMPRSEAAGMISSILEKVSRIENRLDSSEGQILGVRDHHKETQSNVGLWVSLVAVLISAVILFLRFKQ